MAWMVKLKWLQTAQLHYLLLNNIEKKKILILFSQKSSNVTEYTSNQKFLSFFNIIKGKPEKLKGPPNIENDYSSRTPI